MTESWTRPILYTPPHMASAKERQWIGLDENEMEYIRNAWGLQTYEAIKETENMLRVKNMQG
jgi:hypothetical protein